ncbi:MAG: glutamate--cysteine ligase [Pseudomonadales bacterium]|nr:glutamate--cysteine ligase [Pseudomonadales bacterium]
MGDEISHRFFSAEDFTRFRERLDEETSLLRRQFDRGELSPRGDTAGFELEAWLIDKQGNALPENDRFLDRLHSPLVVPELAKFNVELNGSPSALTGRVFTRLHDELDATWSACRRTASGLNAYILAIGTLPTATQALFDAHSMSAMMRYQSLNDRVMALRDGRDLTINIEGDQPLRLHHHDVMLEAATTSFQIHLQCRPPQAVRDFNASMIASAATVAAGANSPLLFGHLLWDESRIPLFEQAVDVGDRYPARVSFGDGYIRESLLEIFEENQREHLILIPMVQDTPPARFAHVRFHNGTVWRWNRPLIGFDFDGQVHLRIEHRVVSAGPTTRDCIANAAFYFGLVRGLGLQVVPPETQLPFADARDNFYKAARYGLNAQVVWPDAQGSLRATGLRRLIADELLPLARRGLASMDIPDREIEDHLGIIAARVDNSQNGSAWQRRWLTMNDASLHELVLRYRELQDGGDPVHTWPL